MREPLNLLLHNQVQQGVLETKKDMNGHIGANQARLGVELLVLYH